MLIVIDAYAPGCTGTTIAAGLRELGLKIPIVLITKPGQRLPITTDEALHVVDSNDAISTVAKLANVGGSLTRDSPVPLLRSAERSPTL
jgi:hypothetical protein